MFSLISHLGPLIKRVYVDLFSLRNLFKIKWFKERRPTQRKVLGYKVKIKSLSIYYLLFLLVNFSLSVMWRMYSWISMAVQYLNTLLNVLSNSSGTFWFWNSAVVELCSWKDMAYMYGTDCFPESSPPYHTLVFGEVQTMDCCMTPWLYLLIYHIHYFGLLLHWFWVGLLVFWFLIVFWLQIYVLLSLRYGCRCKY